MLEPSDDPIETIMQKLTAILAIQQTILTRLDIIDRKLASRD